MRLLSAVALSLATLVGACRGRDAPGESCDVAADGPALDASGHPDGMYVVRDGRLGAAPLASRDRLAKTGEGVDPNGKRWIVLHLGPDEARAVRDLTANPSEKRIALVSGGEIASLHKVRAAITSADVKVSCCNPRACERWNASLGSR